MSEQSLTGFRLAKSGGDGCWPYLDEAGAFHGLGTPLLKQQSEPWGSEWTPRSQSEIEELFSVGYGAISVDATGWVSSLKAVANALNKGDRSLAAIALVLCRIPPLPSLRNARAMSRTDHLAKYSPNQPRLPKGEHGGGEWTGEDGPDAGINDLDFSPASRPNGAGEEYNDDKWLRQVAFQANLTDVIFSPDALEIWRAVRDFANLHGFTVETAKNIVEGLLKISPEEYPADVAALLQPPKTLEALRPQLPPASFTSWSALERYVGPAPPGYEWHHIIEQSVIREHPGDPAVAEQIQSTKNIVLIPKITHLFITAEMNGNGVRAGVHAKSFAGQYMDGLTQLQKWGGMIR